MATDLECLRKIIKEKFPKLTWHEGATTYRWFNSFLDDWRETERTAAARGIDPSQFGKCSHKISLDGCPYDIGVTKRNDGEGYSLVWDIFEGGGHL